MTEFFILGCIYTLNWGRYKPVWARIKSLRQVSGATGSYYYYTLGSIYHLCLFSNPTTRMQKVISQMFYIKVWTKHVKAWRNKAELLLSLSTSPASTTCVPTAELTYNVAHDFCDISMTVYLVGVDCSGAHAERQHSREQQRQGSEPASCFHVSSASWNLPH